MAVSDVNELGALLTGPQPAEADYATRVVDLLLPAAQQLGASDLHLQPAAGGLEVKLRIDGVLQTAALLPCEAGPRVVGRLKVLAGLLTYCTDRPQEGRIRPAEPHGGPANPAPLSHSSLPSDPAQPSAVAAGPEMRLSTFPTLHGERAVVRLFAGARQFARLDDLGLHPPLRPVLDRLLAETSGVVLVSGPAGSGKTTTLYACLRELAAQSRGERSLLSIEDPIEMAVDGVAQTQVNPAAGLDLAAGVRALMRHDPEVILIGEIRDRPTAQAAMQAGLTGQLVLSAFHAGSAAETVGRLLDMGIEPYILRSGLLGVLSQRLLRRLCDCARWSDDPGHRLGLPVASTRVPTGCKACGQTGYRGRALLAELLLPEPPPTGQAILARAEAEVIERRAVESGMVTRWQRAAEMVDAGVTGAAEVRRAMGFGRLGAEGQVPA